MLLNRNMQASSRMHATRVRSSNVIRLASSSTASNRSSSASFPAIAAQRQAMVHDSRHAQDGMGGRMVAARAQVASKHAEAVADERVPVTIITGFLGAGKASHGLRLGRARSKYLSSQFTDDAPEQHLDKGWFYGYLHLGIRAFNFLSNPTGTRQKDCCDRERVWSGGH